MSETKRIVKSILFIGSIFLLNACVVVVKNDPNYRPTTQDTTRTATAYQYWYYYPENRVYYHITERYYYYPVGNSWQKTRHLPKGWVLNNEGRVRLKLSGKPYLKHAYHQREYPSKKVVDSDNPRHNAKNNTFPRRNWASGQQDQEEHPGNNGQQNRPTDTRGYAVSEEARQRQLPPGHTKSDSKSERERGNSADAPGRTAKGQENARTRPEHAQGKPEKNKQNNNGKVVTKKNNVGGTNQGQNRHEKSNQARNERAQNGHNNDPEQGKQKHNKPDVEKNEQKSQAANSQHGKPNKAPSEQAMQKGNPDKNQQAKSVKQPEHRNAATPGKSVASKAADDTTKKHSQGPSNVQGSEGRQEKFKSHDIDQANLTEDADQQSKIPVSNQPTDHAKQAKNKGGNKTQAKLSGNKGKAKQKSKSVPSSDENPESGQGGAEVSGNSDNDISRKGKEKEQ